MEGHTIPSTRARTPAPASPRRRTATCTPCSSGCSARATCVRPRPARVTTSGPTSSPRPPRPTRSPPSCRRPTRRQPSPTPGRGRGDRSSGRRGGRRARPGPRLGAGRRRRRRHDHQRRRHPRGHPGQRLRRPRAGRARAGPRARARPVAASRSDPSRRPPPSIPSRRRSTTCSDAALPLEAPRRPADRSRPSRARRSRPHVTFDGVTEPSNRLRVVDAVDEPAAAAFTLTPFEAIDADAAAEPHADADAIWDAAVPELGLDVAPLLDLDDVDDADDDEAPAAATAVVLPWPSHEPKAPEPAAAAQDLIEAALSGLTPTSPRSRSSRCARPTSPSRRPTSCSAWARARWRFRSRPSPKSRARRR